MRIFDLLKYRITANEENDISENNDSLFRGYEIKEREIVVTSPVCPYCMKALEKMPARKRKCPHCQKDIAVRTSPMSGERVLLKEDQVEQIETIWTEYRYSNKWIKKLNSEYGITTKQLLNKKEELRKRFTSDPDLPDVIWSAFIDQVERIAKHSPVDYHSLKMLFFNQAMFLYEAKMPFFDVLQQASKMELLHYQQEGVKKVEILAAGNSCGVCKKINGKKFTVKKALQDMPIPHRQCNFELDGETKGWCRCCYIPCLD